MRLYNLTGRVLGSKRLDGIDFTFLVPAELFQPADTETLRARADIQFTEEGNHLYGATDGISTDTMRREAMKIQDVLVICSHVTAGAQKFMLLTMKGRIGVIPYLKYAAVRVT